ncbi:MAG: PHP domain-containing protein [Phycisphaerae bacterium]|nr:PHP domain-containing protein [Phycisphaerae bacterium]
MIDLHTHTTASDGSYSPTGLVELAEQVALEGLAITDHDTLAGLAEAQQAAEGANLELVNGVELACKVPVGTLHILGYFIELDDRALGDLLGRMVESRRKRNPQIIAKLNELGYEITMAEVRAQASGPIVSRLHIALLMLDKGYVGNVHEAFGRFLGDEGSAYVQRTEPKPGEAIELIHQAGGLAVVAHPVHLRAGDEQELSKKLKELADLGLDGLEVWYPEHTAELTEQLWRICQRLDLAAVGGSDFHGAVKEHIKLGTGRGGLNIPLEILERLKKRLSRKS